MKLEIKKRFHPNAVARMRLANKDSSTIQWNELPLDRLLEFYAICLQENFESCLNIIEYTLVTDLNQELFVVPRDLFKHFSASMISMSLAKFVNEIEDSVDPAFFDKILNLYYPPSFALYICYLLAVSFEKASVVSAIETFIDERRLFTVRWTMSSFLTGCLKDPDVITRLSDLQKEVSALTEEVEVQEDIEKHDTLNPILFDGDKLKPEVREKATEIADELLQMMKESGLDIKLHDLIITGSNASYNYTKDSDIDLHLVADMSGIDDPAGLYPILFDSFKSSFNRKFDIAFYDIPVEVYIESGSTPRVSKGVYSVYNDAWVKEPKNEEIPEVDNKAIDKALDPWIDRYKKLIKDTDEDSCTDSTPIENYINEIYELRQKGLSGDGEYSVENLVFKEVRNLGYLDRLKELLDIITTNRLSITEGAHLSEDYDFGTKQIENDSYIDTSVASTFATRDMLQGKNDGAYTGLTYNIVNVTPTQYFELCSVVQDASVSDLKRWVSFDKQTLEKLATVITEKNEQFPMPYVNFTDNYEIGNQEGKHRMYVLGELFGWDDKKYPVMIIQSKSNYRPTSYWLQQAIK